MVTFDRAEFVAAPFAAIPGDDAPWREVALPHNWYRNPPQGRTGWYRMQFELAGVPDGNYRIILPRELAFDTGYFVNRALVGRHADMASRLFIPVAGVEWIVPRSLLKPGANVIHIRMAGNPASVHAMSQVQVGPAESLHYTVRMRRLLQRDVILIFGFAIGIAGLLALALWWTDRSDRALFWYGATGAGLAAVTAAWFPSVWLEMNDLRRVLSFVRSFGALTPLAVLHLRFAGLRLPRLEAALWLLLAAACASVAQPWAWNAQLFSGFVAFYSVFPLMFLPLLLRPQPQFTRLSRCVLGVTSLAAGAFGLHDLAVRYALLGADETWLIYYAIPVLMLGAGVAIVERYVATRRELRRLNEELERRVAQKTAEVEATYASMRKVEQERALARERQRIMADMHDGLGSRLVGALGMAQSGKSSMAEIEAEIAAALNELRVTVDSLETVEGDIGVVLGNMRHRMRSAFDKAGVQLAWNIGELPRMEHLTPERVLAVQRILLEIFTNALQHARARVVTVSTARADGSIAIEIADDGRGFDAGAHDGGQGLRNLQRRAREAGGSIEVHSRPGGGTRAVLSLPLDR